MMKMIPFFLMLSYLLQIKNRLYMQARVPNTSLYKKPLKGNLKL